MKIGIMADTHNHIENTRRALDIFRQRGVERIVHCGDIGSSQIVALFEGWQTTFVFGNIERDHADLMRAARRLMGAISMGYHYDAIIEGARVAVYHGDDDEVLASVIESGQYDYVFHGHTHLRRDDQIGHTRVINPGALGGTKKEARSVCVLSLPDGKAVFVEIEEPQS